jgi:hypothetical protein
VPWWGNGGHWDASPPEATAQVAVRCVLATGKAVGWDRVLLPHWTGGSCSGTVPWANGGYWDASPPAGFTQVAVRCVLANKKAVGLGCCCHTGLVDVAPEPCLGRTWDTGTPRLLRQPRRWRFGVCSQQRKLSGWGAVAAMKWWRLLRNRALGEPGGDGTPPLLRDSRRWRFGVCRVSPQSSSSSGPLGMNTDEGLNRTRQC